MFTIPTEPTAIVNGYTAETLDNTKHIDKFNV